MAKATIEARPGRWTGAERRRQVAAVALQVIARQGVQGATMGRIAVLPPQAAAITATPPGASGLGRLGTLPS